MFFLPIGDEPNLRGTPYVNYGLIAVNVLIFVLVSLPLMSAPIDPRDPAAQDYINYLLQQDPRISSDVIVQSVSAYQVFTWEWGFRPAQPTLATLFSTMFLHGDMFHLGGNMLFLWIYGDNVEHRLGPWSYLAMYLLTGIVATLTFSAFAFGSQTPLIGASGAISGALGFYFVWFPRNQVRILVWIFLFIRIVLVPARFVIGFYLLWDNVLPFLLGTQSGVAYGAHIGGTLGGMAVAWVFERYGEQDGALGTLIRRIDHRRAAQREAGVSFTPLSHRQQGGLSFGGLSRGRAPPAVLEGSAGFSQALAGGNMEMAFRVFAELSADERREIPDGELMKLADHYTDQGDYDSALSILQRFIGLYDGDDRSARGHLRAGLIYLHFTRQPEKASAHLHAVLDLHPSAEMENVVRNALSQLD
ncbi:MAG: rhomboid family intramembrane serine protease [Myxococcota bacterium]